jgi:hypothetical protein
MSLHVRLCALIIVCKINFLRCRRVTSLLTAVLHVQPCTVRGKPLTDKTSHKSFRPLWCSPFFPSPISCVFPLSAWPHRSSMPKPSDEATRMYTRRARCLSFPQRALVPCECYARALLLRRAGLEKLFYRRFSCGQHRVGLAPSAPAQTTPVLFCRAHLCTLKIACRPNTPHSQNTRFLVAVAQEPVCTGQTRACACRTCTRACPNPNP